MVKGDYRLTAIAKLYLSLNTASDVLKRNRSQTWGPAMIGSF